MPEAAKGPAFSAAVGLLVYPQVAHAEHFEPRSGGFRESTGTDGYIREGRAMDSRELLKRVAFGRGRAAAARVETAAPAGR